MRKLLSMVMLAALVVGCGGDEAPQAGSTVTPAAAEEHQGETHELDLEGYSQGVKDYYGGAHKHDPDDELASIEAEYHQPPKPAEANLGEAIELTGTEIGVRFRVTPTDVKPLNDDLMAVYLNLKSTGIAIYERPLEQATLTYPGQDPTPLAKEARAECSNGLDGILRIDVGRSRSGCLLFPRSGDAMPERLQLALEVVPVEAGGIWNLSARRR